MYRQADIFLKLAFLLLLPVFSYSQQDNSDSIYVDTTEMYYYEDDNYYDEGYYGEDYYEEDYYQEDYDSEYKQMGDVNFLTSIPIKTGQRNFNHKPVGVDIAYSRQIKHNAPFYGLIGMSYSLYGYESFPYYSPSQIEGYGDEWEESFRSHILKIYTGGRYFSKRSYSIFNPYIQFDLCYRYLFGVINTRNIAYGAIVDTDSKGGNGSLGYDISLGSLIDINSGNLFLNFALEYDGGGGLKYFNRKNDPGQVFFVTDYFEQSYIPTSFLSFKIGLIFY